jgi:hypothetical protein
MKKLRKKQLVDTLMEAYINWRDACLEVSDSYASWNSARGVRAAVAFGSYMAALDREEEAARVYGGLVQRTSELLWPGTSPAEARDGSPRGVAPR